MLSGVDDAHNIYTAQYYPMPGGERFENLRLSEVPLRAKFATVGIRAKNLIEESDRRS